MSRRSDRRDARVLREAADASMEAAREASQVGKWRWVTKNTLVASVLYREAYRLDPKRGGQ